MRTIRFILALASLGVVSLTSFAEGGGAGVFKQAAERYFRAVYEGDLARINELAADDVVISYPIFETIFGKRAIRGLEGLKGVSTHFSTKWVEPEIKFDEVIQEGNTVVLVWRFRGRDSEDPNNQKQSWGGITLIHFNADGKVISEVGEESSPGPSGRLEN